MFREIKLEKELIDLVTENIEVVLYGAGSYTDHLMLFLFHSNVLFNVCCVAVKAIEQNREKKYSIPLLPISSLPHIYGEAVFLVSVRPEIRTSVCEELQQLGCKDIAYLSDDLWEKIYNMDFAKEEQEHRMLQLSKDIDAVQTSIYEQNEVCQINGKTFAEYRGCNQGKDIAIIGSGPTLKYYKPMENVLHIGVNRCWKREDITFDYYFTQDWNRLLLTYPLGEGLDKVAGEIFVGRYLGRETDTFSQLPEIYYMNNGKAKEYMVEYPTKRIYQNILCHPLMDFGSVIFPAIHFALYTHPRKIYLVGCDTGRNGRFDGRYNLKEQEYTNMKYAYRNWKIGYAQMRTFAQYLYPDVDIISINPIGLKGLFTDIYTKDFLKVESVR